MGDLTQYLDPEILAEMVLGFIPKLVAAILVLAAFWVLLRITRPGLRRLLRTADFSPALIGLLVDNVYRFAIWAVALIMALGQLGVNVAAAVAGLGVAGIAIGFAAQDSLQNTIAGFLIFWDKPFLVGDFITTQDQYGRVADITMRTTRIRTPDNTYLVIPNSKIITDVLVNHSQGGNTRVQVPIGIAYSADIATAREALLEAARGTEDVLEDPAPEVVLKELGDSSVNLAVRVWIKGAADERAVHFRALENCKNALGEAGIEIPFPQLQLYLDGVKEEVWKGVRELSLVKGGDGRGDEQERGEQGGDAGRAEG